MPATSQLEHRYVANTALAFRTLDSPTSVDPRFADGSNILTSLKGYAERRPGFGSVSIPAPVAGFSGTIKRIFWWRLWGGNFIGMVSTVDASNAYVYKYISGTDTNASLLYTQTGSTEPFDFVVSNNTLYLGNGASNSMRAWDGSSATTRKWGITAPSVAPTLGTTGTGISIFSTSYYVYTYCNSSTNHESSPSPLSSGTGLISNKTMQVTVTASTDTQVDTIRIYRSTDGGSNAPDQMLEISGSPFANASATYNDATADTALGTRTAPPFYRNDPPPACKGFVAYGGRLWGFANATTYFSGFEEIRFGVLEECWPGSASPQPADKDLFPWDQEVTAHASLSNGIAVFTADKIYKIEGESLDTFRRYILAEHQGTRQRAAVRAFGGVCVWLDTSGAVWLLGGNELSQAIRPTLAPIDSTQAQLAIHMQNQYRWIVLMDGANGILYVYDIDTQQWMPPWNIAGGCTALHSGETALGTYDLCLAINGNAQKMTSSNYQDVSSTYTAFAKSNLFNIVPDSKLLEAFDRENPEWRGSPVYIGMETGTAHPNKLQILVDDATTSTTNWTTSETTAGWLDVTSIGDNPVTPAMRRQGTVLLENQYKVLGSAYAGRRVGLRIDWPAVNQNFYLYSLDVAYERLGK